MVSKNEALFEPSPCRQTTCSGPPPAISVEIAGPPVSTREI